MGRTSTSRQRLMDAAHSLIWNYSYGAVTIEAICEQAKVKKGSFYYFFDSKADLAVAAINAWWDERRALAAQVFHPDVPPLERIARYLDFVTQEQLKNFEETGQILGCPIFTLGSEICTQDARIRSLLQEILTVGSTLFEQSVRDANACGVIHVNDVALKGRQLWAFYEGSLTRARIENNPELLRSLTTDALALVGPHAALVA